MIFVGTIHKIEEILFLVFFVFLISDDCESDFSDLENCSPNLEKTRRTVLRSGEIRTKDGITEKLVVKEVRKQTTVRRRKHFLDQWLLRCEIGRKKI